LLLNLLLLLGVCAGRCCYVGRGLRVDGERDENRKR
jgi:hypothetical protein